LAAPVAIRYACGWRHAVLLLRFMEQGIGRETS
jgi:hypothetical protein